MGYEFGSMVGSDMGGNAVLGEDVEKESFASPGESMVSCMGMKMHCLDR